MAARMTYSIRELVSDLRSSVRGGVRLRELGKTLRAIRSLIKLTTAEGRANPYPLYKSAMRWGPVIFIPNVNWLVVNYDEAAAALRDERLSSHLGNRVLRKDFPKERLEEFRRNHEAARIREWMLFQDGADHHRLRNLVSRAFTPRVVEQMRPRIEQIANGLLDAGVKDGRIDLVSDFAYPLPMTVICDLLDVPSADRPMFREWTRKLARALDPGFGADDNIDIVRHGDEAWAAFVPYFTDLVNARREKLADDLLSAMIRASDGEDRLTLSELVAQSTLLLVAGHETTANLIANGMLALLQNTDQLNMLRAEPSLMKGAVEELLRFESPVIATIRIALEDIEIGRTRIPRGHDVIVAIGAANRDPSQFVDPDRLDVTRKDVNHLAFSAGAHFCLGASLARLEAEIAFNTLLGRFARIECETDEPKWRDTITIRGLKTLPLRVTA